MDVLFVQAQFLNFPGQGIPAQAQQMSGFDTSPAGMPQCYGNQCAFKLAGQVVHDAMLTLGQGTVSFSFQRLGPVFFR